MEVLLFKNRFLTFDNLVYLALDGMSIPLFVGRPLLIMGVKHLTIFDDYGKSHGQNDCKTSVRSELNSQ